jgi:hypothetical protein
MIASFPFGSNGRSTCVWLTGQPAAAAWGSGMGVMPPGYRNHAEEGSVPIQDRSLVFTSFPSRITGPNADVEPRSNHPRAGFIPKPLERRLG